MAAPVEFEDSSSEDEEALAKLKEAATETNLLIKSQVPSKKSEETHVNKKREAVETKSLRPDKQSKEEDYRTFIETTPGVRRHIAKKLSSVLESEIDSSAQCFCPVDVKVSADNTGVKLFQQSTRFVSEEDGTIEKVKQQKKRRPPSPSSTDSSEDEKLAEASVSHDFVINQSYQPYFSNHKPPDVIVSAEGASSHCDSAKNSNTDKPDKTNGDLNNEQDSDHHSKKKKKKKKHKKCHEDG